MLQCIYSDAEQLRDYFRIEALLPKQINTTKSQTTTSYERSANAPVSVFYHYRVDHETLDLAAVDAPPASKIVSVKSHTPTSY